MKETWVERRCLVTGANGFVASHIAKRLALLGAEVFGVAFLKSPPLNIDSFFDNSKKITILYGDITDYQFIKDIFRLNHIDTCFHLAASTIISKAAKSPLTTFQTNIMGTCNVLEAARNCETIERIVVASSDKAYGLYKENQLPYKEEYELRGIGVYDCSKACADMIARSYFFNFGLPVVVTRCSNIYGPGDYNLSRVIPSTIVRLLKGEPPIIYLTSQNHVREYTYIDDIVEAYLLLAQQIDETKGKAYNVGAGDGNIKTTKELVWNIIHLMDSSIKPLIVKKESPFREIPYQYLSTERIRKLGWAPKVSLDEGLHRTIQWYRAHLDEVLSLLN